MKVGDLISFKPIGFGKEDWSPPCIVIREYEVPNSGLWIVWCDGMDCVVDEENYDIAYLVEGCANEGGRFS